MSNNGFSLIEVILALALVSASVVVVTTSILYVNGGTADLHLVAQARLSMQECQEAVHWIRDAQGLAALADGIWELIWVGGTWTLTVPDSGDDGDIIQRVTLSSYDDHTKRSECTTQWTGPFGLRDLSMTGLLSAR